MKKLILLLFGILSFGLSFGQTNFKWEKTDSVAKTKGQIYSDTKLFIAEKWKSAKDVIQNDDKETGVILVKGVSSKFIFNQLGATYSYSFSYNVTFRMKDNKYKCIIDDVKCFSTEGSSFDNKLFIEPHELNNCPYKNKKFGEKCTKIMIDLETELQSISSDYEKYIKAPSSTIGEW